MKTMLETRRFKLDCLALGDRLDVGAAVAIMLACDRTDERALAFDDLQVVRR